MKQLLLIGCPIADHSPLAGGYLNLEVRDFEVRIKRSERFRLRRTMMLPLPRQVVDSMLEDPMLEKRVRKMLNRLQA